MFSCEYILLLSIFLLISVMNCFFSFVGFVLFADLLLAKLRSNVVMGVMDQFNGILVRFNKKSVFKLLWALLFD